MWRGVLRRVVLITALLSVLNTGRAVRAEPITYESFGDVGATAGVPIGNFSINPTSGTLTQPGTLTLAAFQAEALPAGASLTYTNLPFYIEVYFYPQGTGLYDQFSELYVTGVLNGTVTGSNFSDVVATVMSFESPETASPPFSLGSISMPSQVLAPSAVNGGVTELVAVVAGGSEVPEPSVLAMAGLLAGVGIGRVALRRRRAARSSSPS